MDYVKRFGAAKYYFVAILFLGSIVHLAVHVGYFLAIYEWELPGYPSVIFLLSFLFGVVTAYSFGRRCTGRMKRFTATVFGGITHVVLWTFALLPFFFVSSLIGGSSAENPNPEMSAQRKIVKRFQDGFGIELGSGARIVHASEWRVGAEFGFDLIAKVDENQLDKLAPNGTSFSLLAENTDQTPFRFSNKEFICSDAAAWKTQAEGRRAFDLICTKASFPSDTEIAELIINQNRTVTSVYVPGAEILWITETKW